MYPWIYLILYNYSCVSKKVKLHIHFLISLIFFLLGNRIKAVVKIFLLFILNCVIKIYFKGTQTQFLVYKELIWKKSICSVKIYSVHVTNNAGAIEFAY